MTEHQTSLISHIKQKNTLIDLVVLIILWGMITWAPMGSLEYYGITLTFFVKIVALFASLEFIAFISFHLVGNKRSLILQGFLGGFISSTAVFIQLNYDKRFENIRESVIARAQLLATIATLIESIVIIALVSKFQTTLLLVPFVIMLFFLISSMIFLKITNNKTKSSLEGLTGLEINKAVDWKKVMTMACYIAGLKYLFIILPNFVSMPVNLGIFLASLFEAHAVLAVVVTNLNESRTPSDIFTTILLILVGSCISKMFFVFRGTVLEQKRLVLLPLIFSLALTIAVSLLLAIF